MKKGWETFCRSLFLDSHPAVQHVYRPDLTTHPNHWAARKQQKGFGGVLFFKVAGGLAEANNVQRSVKGFALAESPGGVESLIDHPVSMTHASMDSLLRQEAGITDNLIRLSVELEHIDGLFADLENGLSTLPM